MSTTTDLAPPGPGDAADEGDARRDDPKDTVNSDNGRRAERPTSTRFALWLGLVALGGLAIRLIYVLVWKNPGPEYGDAVYYHEGANYLADGEGYVHPFQLMLHGLRIPGADHPPGYLTCSPGSRCWGSAASWPISCSPASSGCWASWPSAGPGAGSRASGSGC